MKHKGFSLTEVLIVGALFGAVLVVGTLMLSAERARVRDAQRLADMAQYAGAFAVLYAQNASYADAAAGCTTVGAAADSCTLPVLTSASKPKDPGRFRYEVAQVPSAENFGITFRLERSYGSLAAGVHTLTKTGIR